MGLAAEEPRFEGFFTSPDRLWIHPSYVQCTGVKQPVREADHSPSIAEVENGGAIPHMYNDFAVLAFFMKCVTLQARQNEHDETADGPLALADERNLRVLREQQIIMQQSVTACSHMLRFCFAEQLQTNTEPLNRSGSIPSSIHDNLFYMLPLLVPSAFVKR
jgi:hypothetical protein